MIKDLVPEYVENGVFILQYADDTILCLQDDREQASHLKLLLYLYEAMSTSLEFSNMFNGAIGNGQLSILESLWLDPDYILPPLFSCLGPHDFSQVHRFLQFSPLPSPSEESAGRVY